MSLKPFCEVSPESKDARIARLERELEAANSQSGRKSAKGKKRSPETLARIRAAAKKRIKPLAERFWAKVDKRGPDECWPWLGNKNPHGYGQIYPGPDRARRYGDNIFAHHVATELAGIEVPPGMVRDHTCKSRDCQNPAHIRIVTQAVNTTENSDCPQGVNFRKTECKRGHPFDAENTSRPKSGGRACRACRKIHNANYALRQATK